MSQDRSSPPSPDAPSDAIANNKVALVLFAPSSLTSPALHQCANVVKIFFRIASKLTLTRGFPISYQWGIPLLRRRGGVKCVTLGCGVFDCMAISLVLEIHSKQTMLMSVPELIQTKKRTSSTYPLRRTSSFEPLRSQSSKIQRGYPRQ
jgi:hypothetical protein